MTDMASAKGDANVTLSTSKAAQPKPMTDTEKPGKVALSSSAGPALHDHAGPLSPKSEEKFLDEREKQRQIVIDMARAARAAAEEREAMERAHWERRVARQRRAVLTGDLPDSLSQEADMLIAQSKQLLATIDASNI